MKPIFLLCCFLFVVSSFAVHAQVYPANFTQVEVASGIAFPTAMAFAPDGRIFIAQQNGVIHVIKNGIKLATPALQLSVNSTGERGLIGMTLHPSFSTNGIIYLYYTLPDGSRNRVSRFWFRDDVINAASEEVILNLDLLSTSSIHNGGAMQFKGDKLYIAVGDNANGANAQNLNTYHGKLLRINASGSTPGDNPFYNLANTAQRNAVWALGLRNPFTFDIQPGTGRIFVNDVGQNTWEEIDDATTKGLNFGWPSTEGNTTNAQFTSPYFSYGHGAGDGVGCAITGGVFFNPTATNYPAMYSGKYFYLDYCNSWINYIDLTNPPVRHAFATGLPAQPLALDLGTDGNLYFITRAGRLFKVVFSGGLAASIVDEPDDQIISSGGTAAFSVTATGSPPLSYQWRKNGVPISGANSSSYTISNAQLSHEGSYSVVVSNAFGSDISVNALLDITQNSLPQPIINTPSVGALYRAGENISFSGAANDPDDGTLPASALSWSIAFHHDDHVHDGPPIANGTSGNFLVPTSGETSTNVFYRLHLTATDSDGASASTYVDVKPHTSYVALRSNPAGLRLNFDGVSYLTPYTIKRVEGLNVSIGANGGEQVLNGQSYRFESWAHGGTTTQTFPTPIENTTYLGNFSSALGVWRTMDIGKMNIFGNATLTEGTFTLNATGVDIWNTSDHFRFVYRQLTGNGEIIARVTSISNTHAWAKAGVMMRSGLTTSSPHASVFMTPASGASFQSRVNVNGTSVATNSAATLPHWVRIVRNGNTFTGYKSTNGTAWTLVGSQTISMGSTIYIGLAYTSHNANTAGTAAFTNVSHTGTVSSAEIGEPEIARITAGKTRLYPNPVKGDVIYVQLDGDHSGETYVEIVNTLGQSTQLQDVAMDSDGTLAIQLGPIPRGLYFLKIASGLKAFRGSFVRE